MNPIVQRVLEAYDELGREALELSMLAKFAGQATIGSMPNDRDTVRSTLTQMVREGLLRRAGGGDLFERTEDGRLALAGPRDVTLYTRPGCHLCAEAKALMAPLLREFGAKLREVNIDADPALRERYTNDVPVILLGPRKVAKHRVNPKQLRRQLEQSSR